MLTTHQIAKLRNQKNQNSVRNSGRKLKVFDPMDFAIKEHCTEKCPKHGQSLIRVSRSKKIYYCREKGCLHKWYPLKSRAAKFPEIQHAKRPVGDCKGCCQACGDPNHRLEEHTEAERFILQELV